MQRLLKGFGVDLDAEASIQAPGLGIKLAAGEGEVRVANVFDGGPAQRAGLSAGDVLIALDGLRLSPKGLEAQLKRRQVGDRVELHAFRRDELMRFSVELDPPAVDRYVLRFAPRSGERARRLRKGWLGR